MHQDDTEIRELRRLIRDLVALATTPAGWVGREPAQIAESVADTVLHALRAQAVYVVLDSANPIQAARLPEGSGFREEVSRLLSASGTASMFVASTNLPGWPVPLRVAIYPIGLFTNSGFIAIGSTNAAFPSEAESLLLSVAANQASVAVQAAKLRLEAELERRRLGDLLAQAPALIGLMAGPEHHWTYVNERYVHVTGRQSAADFLGKTIRESLPELESQPFFALLDDVYQSGKPYVGREIKVTLNRAKSGQPEHGYFDFVYQPVRNVEGAVESILVHAVEVTEKVMARKALEQSEERFRAIVETTPECVKLVAADGTLLHMNSAGLSMLGADSAESVVGKNIYDIIAPYDRERYRRFNEWVCSGERASLTFDIIGLTGIKRHMESHAAPLRRDDGTLVQLAITLDITERRRIEEAKHRLAAIVESSEDAIVSKNLNGIVTSWNPAAEKMFGYTAEEMIGESIKKLIPPELQEDENRILATIGRGERIEHFETVRVRKSGERLDVSLTISPVKDDAGRIIGAAKIARNITAQKKAEHVLRTTERLASVGRLAATVAHEINNPLEAVTNFVYLSKQRSVQKDVCDLLTGAQAELKRISHLTKQTLGFYRDTEAATAMTLGSTIAPLVSVFAYKTRTRRIEISSEIKEDPVICAVPGEMRQVIANLLSNSIDALGESGRIKIRISAARLFNGKSSPGVRLTIADSGPGISLQERSKLFEPFFTTKKDVGTGLGLWICKNIIDKHHGIIRVRSSTIPGRSWTAFSVCLPMNSQPLAAEGDLGKV